MAGVKGAGGPPPKRDAHRRRRGELALGKTADKATGAASVVKPEADPDWHPVASRWFDSLASSGQSAYYEPSDWATAFLVAESMSRELKPQPVVDSEGNVSFVSYPPKGASLAAWLKAMTTLMVTEGDRRRLRLELERPPADSEDKGAAGVTHIDDAARRLRGGAG